MSQIFGWAPADPAADVETVADRMAAALRVAAVQRMRTWMLPGLGIGVIEPPALGNESDDLEPPYPGSGPRAGPRNWPQFYWGFRDETASRGGR